MIRVVFDTNVLASGLATERGTPGVLLDRWADGVFELAISDYIFTELTETLEQPYFQLRYSRGRIPDFVARLRRDATLTEIIAVVQGVASHYHDDPVIATAVSAGAAYLVTGDKELRAVGGYGGVTFLTPREFLDLLDRGGGDES